MKVHERIKNRRKELNLTADDVAEALCVSRATVYRYESAEIEKLPTSILEPLSTVLKCTPAYLMGWDENSESDSSLESCQEEKAKELYSLYEQASPEVQSAVELLLKSAQHAPESQLKN